jgi:hypothetical protein
MAQNIEFGDLVVKPFDEFRWRALAVRE